MSLRGTGATLFFAASCVALGLAATAVPGCAQAPARTGSAGAGGVEPADLAAIRSATERFQDVQVALAEGYVPDPTNMCVTSAMEGMPRQLGAMGIHYFRPDRLGITGPPNPRVDGTGTHTDFLQPGVLIYEPQPDGSLKLVAVENLVFAKAWQDAGNTAPPAYAGNEYYHMVDNPATPADEAHGFEPHYELHLWLYRENPAGPFMPFNVNATCDHHRGNAAPHAHSQK